MHPASAGGSSTDTADTPISPIHPSNIPFCKHSTAFHRIKLLSKACSQARLSFSTCYASITCHLPACVDDHYISNTHVRSRSARRRTCQALTGSSTKHATAPSGMSVEHSVRTVMTPSGSGYQRLCRNEPNLGLGLTLVARPCEYCDGRLSGGRCVVVRSHDGCPNRYGRVKVFVGT